MGTFSVSLFIYTPIIFPINNESRSGDMTGCWLAPVTFASSRHWGQRRIFLCQSYLIEIRSSVAICSQYCEERAWLILPPDKTILPLFYICHHVRSIYFWMYRDKAPPMLHSQFYKRSLRIFLRRQSVLAPHHEYIESRRNTKIDPSIFWWTNSVSSPEFIPDSIYFYFDTNRTISSSPTIPIQNQICDWMNMETNKKMK